MLKLTDLVRPASKRDARKIGKDFTGKTSYLRIFRVTATYRKGKRRWVGVEPIIGKAKRKGVMRKIRRWILA